MNNYKYFEILLKSHLLKCDSTKNKNVILLESLVKYIHTIIAKNNLQIGISFPNLIQGEHVSFGNKIRLISENENDLNILNESIQQFNMYNFLNCSVVKKINKDKIFGYSAFIKLKNKKLCKKHKNGKYTGLKLENFKNYIEESYRYPNLNIYSSTNNSYFIMCIKRKRLMFTEKNIENKNKFGSYGLSTQSNLVYLPDF